MSTPSETPPLHQPTPAQWAVDPYGTAAWRWWDGTKWTTHLEPLTPGMLSSKPAQTDNNNLAGANNLADANRQKTTTSTNAGWFEDPESSWNQKASGRLRWWNGTNWTEATWPVDTQNGPVEMSRPTLAGRAVGTNREKFHNAVENVTHQQTSAAVMLNPAKPGYLLGGLVLLVGYTVILMLGNAMAAVIIGALLFMMFPLIYAGWKLPRIAQLADRPRYTPTAAHAGTCMLEGWLVGDNIKRQSWMSDTPAMWWSCLTAYTRDRSTKPVHPLFAEDRWGEGPETLYIVDEHEGWVRLDPEAWQNILDTYAPGYQIPNGSMKCMERVLTGEEYVTVLARIDIETDGSLTAVGDEDGNTIFSVQTDSEYSEASVEMSWLMVAVATMFAASTSMVTIAVWAAGASWWILTGWIGAMFVIAGALVGIWYYNRFAVLTTQLEGSWSTIETFTQRRNDLINALEAATKAGSAHVEKVLTAIGAWRVPIIEDINRTNKQYITGTAQLEANPLLKTTELYSRLSDEITRCENQIAGGRDGYNEAVATILRWRAHPIAGKLVRRLTPDDTDYYTGGQLDDRPRKNPETETDNPAEG